MKNFNYQAGIGKLTGSWSSHTIAHDLIAFNDLTNTVGLVILFPNWMKFALNERNAFKFAQISKNACKINDTDAMVAAKNPLMLSENSLTP